MILMAHVSINEAIFQDHVPRHLPQSRHPPVGQCLVTNTGYNLTLSIT